MQKYPAYLMEGFMPYDPIELWRLTEEKVCQGDARKYTDFYCVGVYGGISTGYTVGCCLRCVFCWVDFSRDFPHKYGDFYSAEGAARLLVENARKKRLTKLRISGAEPMLCKEHLLGVLDRIADQGFAFILESNGIPVGYDAGYAAELARYPGVHVRVSIKAGSAQGFEERTGAKGEFWEVPFRAVERLVQAGVSFHVAAMTDPRLMPRDERHRLFQQLREIGYTDWVEEEACDPYRTSLVRLREAGFDIF